MMWHRCFHARLSIATCFLLSFGHTALAGEKIDPFQVMQTVHQPASLLPTPQKTCENHLENKALTLLDTIHLVLCQHPQTREIYANAQYQAAQLGLAQTALLPTVSASVGANQNWTKNSLYGSSYHQEAASIGLSYLIYDFGGRAANIESAKQLIYAANASQDDTIQQLFLATVQAFYQIQGFYASLEAAKQSEQSALTSLKAAETRYQVGTATPADRLQAKTAYSQTVLNRIQIEGNLRNMEGTLANLIGRDANHPLHLQFVSLNALPDNYFTEKSKMTRHLEKEISTLIQEARQKRPDLMASEAQIRSAKAALNAAKVADKPTVTLNTNIGLQHIEGNNSFGNTSTIGVNLNIPIFDGYNRFYRVKAAEAQIATKTAQRDQVYNQVSLDVWKAYQNLVTATQSIETSTDLVNSAMRSEEVNLGRYKAGIGNILDVLNAQTALANAKQQRIQAILNWNIARATLAQSIGQLDYQLLVNLNRPDEKPAS